MSKRTERRAAERVARKLAYKELRSLQSQSAATASVESAVAEDSEPAVESESDLLAKAQAFFNTSSEPTAQSTISDIQLEANRANAQKSSGPKSAAGKAKSSKNALKHGLTGKFTLLPDEDADEYEATLGASLDTYKPATEEERRLVQSMLDCLWRMDRLQSFEAAILLKGHIEFAEKFDDRTPAERTLLIRAESYLKYEKSIRNLHIQEARLQRTREKAHAELLRLQTIRRREEMLTAAAAPTKPAPSPAVASTANGFEFSTSQNRAAAAPNTNRSAA